MKDYLYIHNFEPTRWPAGTPDADPWRGLEAMMTRMDPHTNAGTFAYNPDNSDEANATGLLAWRNSWDTGGLTEKVAAAVTEGDRDKRVQMYLDIQAEFRETSPFVIMFQQIEQSALRDNVTNWSTGQAVTSAAYWQVTK